MAVGIRCGDVQVAVVILVDFGKRLSYQSFAPLVHGSFDHGKELFVVDGAGAVLVDSSEDGRLFFLTIRNSVVFEALGKLGAAQALGAVVVDNFEGATDSDNSSGSSFFDSVSHLF